MKKNLFTIAIFVILLSNFIFASVSTRLTFVSNTFNSPSPGQGTLIIDVEAISDAGDVQIRTFQDAFQLDANLQAQSPSVSFSNELFPPSPNYNTTESYSSGVVTYVYTYNSGTFSTISTSFAPIVRVTIQYTMTNANSTVSWYPNPPNFYVTDNNNVEITGDEVEIPGDLVNFPLPVELTSFTANVNTNNVSLSWKTATEVNNNGFEIQRKVRDQKSEVSGQWEKVGFVLGHGNSNSPKEYSFTDKNLTGGTNFVYRLKQIDNDGQYQFSKEVEVEVVPKQFNLYQNYPNPFNPSTNIKFDLPEAAKVTINIYNILGEKVASLLNKTVEAGFHEVQFNGSDLSSGTYIYRMEASSSGQNFIQTKKMLLLK